MHQSRTQPTCAPEISTTILILYQQRSYSIKAYTQHKQSRNAAKLTDKSLLRLLLAFAWLFFRRVVGCRREARC